MLIERLDKIEKDISVPIKTTYMGNIIRCQYNEHCNHKPTVKKLNNQTYVVVSSGEIKNYSEKKDDGSRIDNQSGIYRSMKSLREIINTNVVYPENCRWVTLTYAEKMTDVQRLYEDFRKFMGRFKYYCSKNGVGIPEFIAVPEPQARGAWHIHAIFIWKGRAPFIANDTLRKIWGFGFVKITKLDNSDNVGLYLTTYLSSIPVDELKTSELLENADKLKESASKAYIKGLRLRMYPAGMKLYRCSRGIRRPKSYYISSREAEKIDSTYKCTYKRSLRVYDQSSSFETFIETKEYNKKRPLV